MRSGRAVVGLGLAAATSACLLLVPIDGDLSEGDGAVPSDDGSSPAPTLDGSPASEGGGGDGGSPDADAGGGTAPIDPCPSADPHLLAWFRFDEDGGASTHDCSSKRWRADSIGAVAPKFVPGHAGNAADFDGTSTCYEVGGTKDFDFDGDSFTVAAWTRVRTYYTPTEILGRHLVGYNPNNGWHFGTDDPDHVELDYAFGDGGKQEVTASIPTAWTHIAATWESGVRARVYVGGQPMATRTTAIPTVFGATPTNLKIGCRALNANHYDGAIDDLRIYDRVLSADEIAALSKL